MPIYCYVLIERVNLVIKRIKCRQKTIRPIELVEISYEIVLPCLTEDAASDVLRHSILIVDFKVNIEPPPGG